MSFFDLAVSFFFRCSLAFVIKLFAFADPDLRLDPRTSEIKGQRNKGQTLLAGLGKQLHNLFFMHEQLLHPHGIPVEDISFFVGTYVHSNDEKLSVDYSAV